MSDKARIRKFCDEFAELWKENMKNKKGD